MEQMYLIEIFVDKVSLFVSEEDETSNANKSLIIKIKFGPKVQFIFKEGQLAVNDTNTDDIIIPDSQGRRKWSRTIRVGKSYLFPSYPDTVLMVLNKFPLEIELWNDDEKEVNIFVGVGTMYWDTQFFHMLKETSDASKLHDSLTIKQKTTLYAECCCKQVGEIAIILRLSALGDTIITEFQQLMKDPESFVFRTNKAPSMFQCKRVEGDNPNFCMVGSLYETTTLEDPTSIENAQRKIEVCTNLQSCGTGKPGADPICEHSDKDDGAKKKKYPINKIRMGDITGPCGNTNCPLAHKIKTYIRALDTYKKEAAGKITDTKNTTGNVCGSCICKDDRYHRDDCPDYNAMTKTTCDGCGGLAHPGETCEDRRKMLYGTGCSPEQSKSRTNSPTKVNSKSKDENNTMVNYVFSVPNLRQSMFGKDFIIENMVPEYKNQSVASATCSSKPVGCCCQKAASAVQANTGFSCPDNLQNNQTLTSKSNNIQMVYNMDNNVKRSIAVYNCTDISEDKDCKCDPPKPSPPCKTFDCDCIAEIGNIEARKKHKPYCPAFKHKTNCPVNMKLHEEEEKKKLDDDEDETEPLPYGLPPIQLGPCPVMGRPCTVPDGFARMYRTAIQPPLPPSYNDAGKVCCSKEYERIKKALVEYMKYEKEHDYRCVNKFNVDTERRCCDKEQRLMALTGKACCGSHKMAIQEKYKDDKK